MGNYFSNNQAETKTTKCSICNNIEDNFIFIDLECSKCKERSKGFYHKECFRKYVKLEENENFICPKCRFYNCGDVF